MVRSLLPLVLLVGCSASQRDVFGPEDALLDVIATRAEGLDAPTDLAFNPASPNDLWITNRGNHTVTALLHAGTDAQKPHNVTSMGARHFLAKPSGIAFSPTGWFATIHEEDERTQGPNGTPRDFMGPTLWPSDLDVWDGGHGSHLDMLHNTPNGVGIAWESGNAYWVFDGWHASITRYNFGEDHGYGGADHSDGIVSRFAEGEVSYVAGVPAHLHYDHDTDILYASDPGNARIVALDTYSGTRGRDIHPNYDGSDQHEMVDADLWTHASRVSPGAPELMVPSGLVRYGDMLLVADHWTGALHAFDMDGHHLDWTDTGLGQGALGGLEIGPEGDLYLVDLVGEQVLRMPLAKP